MERVSFFSAMDVSFGTADGGRHIRRRPVLVPDRLGAGRYQEVNELVDVRKANGRGEGFAFDAALAQGELVDEDGDAGEGAERVGADGPAGDQGAVLDQEEGDVVAGRRQVAGQVVEVLCV